MPAGQPEIIIPEQFRVEVSSALLLNAPDVLANLIQLNGFELHILL
jgi:hypothetical protein